MVYNIKYKIFTISGNYWEFREEIKLKNLLSLGDRFTFKELNYIVVLIDNMDIKKSIVLKGTKSEDSVYFVKGEVYLVLENDI